MTRRNARITLAAAGLLVVDARRARIEARAPGALSAARDVTVHVLTAGMGMEIRD